MRVWVRGMPGGDETEIVAGHDHRGARGWGGALSARAGARAALGPCGAARAGLGPPGALVQLHRGRRLRARGTRATGPLVHPAWVPILKTAITRLGGPRPFGGEPVAGPLAAAISRKKSANSDLFPAHLFCLFPQVGTRLARVPRENGDGRCAWWGSRGVAAGDIGGSARRCACFQARRAWSPVPARRHPRLQPRSAPRRPPRSVVASADGTRPAVRPAARCTRPLPPSPPPGSSAGRSGACPAVRSDHARHAGSAACRPAGGHASRPAARPAGRSRSSRRRRHHRNDHRNGRRCSCRLCPPCRTSHRRRPRSRWGAWPRPRPCRQPDRRERRCAGHRVAAAAAAGDR